jgi:hypothetical protein
MSCCGGDEGPPPVGGYAGIGSLDDGPKEINEEK